MARVVVTKDNATPLIQIITYLCLVVSILAVITRLATKHYLLRRFHSDDYFIIASLVHIWRLFVIEFRRRD